jgi:hypothetical protein
LTDKLAIPGTEIQNTKPVANSGASQDRKGIEKPTALQPTLQRVGVTCCYISVCHRTMRLN